MKTIVAWSAGLVVIACLLTWFIDTQFASDNIHLGVHGVVAIFLCLLIVPALGIGLMRLAHVSDRQGFDEGASGTSADPNRPDKPY